MSVDLKLDEVYTDKLSHLVKVERRADGLWLVSQPSGLCAWRVVNGLAFLASGKGNWLVDEKLDVSKLRPVRGNTDD